MDIFFPQYYTDPSSPTTISLISYSFPSSISQQNTSPSQIYNVHASDNSGQPSYPTPYSTPNDVMNIFPLINNPNQGSSFLMGQSHVPFLLPNNPQVQVQREEERKKMVTLRCKLARENRKQILRHKKLVASKGSEETFRREPLIRRAIQPKTPFVFYTSDGKRFEEILTKQLKNSDVNKFGRIILPKREAEEKLPTPSKEGIEVIINDIHSRVEWKVKFKYWINGKTRMYILENTGDLVKHYNLQMGDFFSLYEDEFKNMYVYIKKKSERQTLEIFPSGDQGKEKEIMHVSNNQLSSNKNIGLHVPDQLVGQGTNITTTSSILDHTFLVDGDGGGIGGGDVGGGGDNDNEDDDDGNGEQ